VESWWGSTWLRTDVGFFGAGKGGGVVVGIGRGGRWRRMSQYEG